MSIPTKRDLIPLLGAISLFFAAIEFLFPKPLPFMRLGLANIPIILALDIFTFPELLLLSLIKVVGQGVVNGTLASYVFVFSLLGTFSSLFVMYTLHRLFYQKWISLVGISMAGALTSNAIQLLLSIFFIFGQNSLVILPIFITVGTVSGFLMGLFAQEFRNKSQWYRKIYEAQR
ncbi:Gx transporter family protein [Spirochaeta cellobiosiphila]|uniref:Gx transporter family protein n=1 Tax=Spirochaeta cellobiosiphila TaxID=504483 RepID=UPI0003F5AE23|nr:Gx transporter family protein [Spirochaeta cellobiosiphila]